MPDEQNKKSGSSAKTILFLVVVIMVLVVTLATTDKYLAISEIYTDLRNNLAEVGIVGVAPTTMRGTFDRTDNVTCSAAGWARSELTTDPVWIHFYKDAPVGKGGIFVGKVLADKLRKDLPYTDQNHGFNYVFDNSVRDGKEHKIYAYAINIKPNPNRQIVNSPKTIICPTMRASVDKPNIVYIMLDDAGYGDFGLYGGKASTTNIDNIGKQGIKLTQFYAQSTCSLARASMLTGLDPQRSGFWTNCHLKSVRGIPSELVTIGEAMQKLGYITGHYGKWHVGQYRTWSKPPQQGFSDAAVLWGNGPTLYLDYTLQENGIGTTTGSKHFDEEVTDRALKFIDANKDNPFFINVWYLAPHKPLTPPREWTALHPNATEGEKYAALLENADMQIGRILKRIDNLGLGKNTLVIVDSDNGAVPTGSNGILRGYKGQLFDGGIREPFVAKWPSQIPAGKISDDVLSIADLFPMFVELGGGQSGSSFLATLKSGDRPGDWQRTSPMFWEIDKFNPSSNSPLANDLYFAMRDSNYKYVFQDGLDFLFDLSQDASESNNLAKLSSYAVKLGEMKQAVDNWRRDVGKINFSFGTPYQGASVSGDEVTLNGGYVPLETDTRIDFHDGTFSFNAKLYYEPAEPGTRKFIAKKNDSWRFGVEADGKLILLLTDSAGIEHSLLSTKILSPGSWHQVGFAVIGHGYSNEFPSNAVIYLDGKSVAEKRSLVDDVKESENPVVIGASGSTFTKGSKVKGVSLWTVPLLERDLPNL